MDLNTLSWIIGSANPLSAVMVGPALVWFLQWRHGEQGIARARQIQAWGWLVLGVGQSAFLAFGYMSKYPGFQIAQPFMIPAAALNLLAWWFLGRKAKREVFKEEGALA